MHKQKLSIYRKLKFDKTLKADYKLKTKEYELAVKSWHNEQELTICQNPCSKSFYSFFKNKMKLHSSISLF